MATYTVNSLELLNELKAASTSVTHEVSDVLPVNNAPFTKYTRVYEHHSAYLVPDSNTWTLNTGEGTYVYEIDETVENTKFLDRKVWDLTEGTPDPDGPKAIELHIARQLKALTDYRASIISIYGETSYLKYWAWNINNSINFWTAATTKFLYQELNLSGLELWNIHTSGWTGKGVNVTIVDSNISYIDSHGTRVKTAIQAVAPAINFDFQQSLNVDYANDIVNIWRRMLMNNDVISMSIQDSTISTSDANEIKQLIADSNCVVVFIAGNTCGSYGKKIRDCNSYVKYGWLSDNVIYISQSKKARFPSVDPVDFENGLRNTSYFNARMPIPSSDVVMQDKYMIAPSNLIKTSILGDGSHGGDTRKWVIDGTSLAAPRVAGIAALLRQRYPNLSASEITRTIKEACDNSSESLDIKYATDSINQSYYNGFHLCDGIGIIRDPDTNFKNYTKSCTNEVEGHGGVNLNRTLKSIDKVKDLSARLLMTEVIAADISYTTTQLDDWTHTATYTAEDNIEYTIYKKGFHIRMLDGTSVAADSLDVSKNLLSESLTSNRIVIDDTTKYASNNWTHRGYFYDDADRHNVYYYKPSRLIIFRNKPYGRHDNSSRIADSGETPIISS